jgi:HKD family nuclease
MLETNQIATYTGQLAPRSGYEVDKALCLTYSLDLTMLMAAGVALFLGKEIEGTTDKERYDVLAALQAGKSKLRVYCHASHIAVPATYNRLYALIEPSVRMVTLTNASFHPKLWLIRYNRVAGNGAEFYFKLIVMSRNLTDSRDWDISFATDGEPTKNQRSNKSLIDYLTRLPVRVDDREFLQKLTDRLGTVAFDLPENCTNWEFIGFPGMPLPLPPKMKRLAVMSPFLTESRLKDLVDQTAKGKLILFSRQESLDEISSALTDKCQCYTLKPSIIEGEKLVQEDFGIPKHNELHAKCYFWEDSAGMHGFMGSANCTQAAFTANYEAMIRIDFKKSTFDSLLDKLIDSESEKNDLPKLFSPYRRGEKIEVDNIKESLDVIRTNLALALPTAEICRRESAYEAIVTFGSPVPIPDGYTVSLYPYGSETLRKTFSGDSMAFYPLSLGDLTAFFVFEIEQQETESRIRFIMRLDLTCTPEILDERESALYRAIFPNIKKLLTYLAWLIEEDTLDDPEISPPRGNPQTDRDAVSTIYESVPFFERLMIIAAENPYRLKRVSAVIDVLKKKNEIPLADFEMLLRFWQPFQVLIEKT